MQHGYHVMERHKFIGEKLRHAEIASVLVVKQVCLVINNIIIF